MLYTVASLMFSLVMTLGPYAERPSMTETATAGPATRPWGPFTVTDEPIFAQAEAGRTQIEPGDTVVVIADGVKLRLGREVVATLEKGKKFRVNRIDGKWVGSLIDVGGEKRGGWVKLSDVKLLSPTTSEPANAETALDPGPAESAVADRGNGVPAESEQDGAGTEPEKEEGPAEPQEKSDGDPVESAGESAAAEAPEKEIPTEPQEKYDVQVMVVFSDADVAKIDRSARINKLKLTGPGVTNAALKDVHDLALVNLLSIEGTQITNAGLGLLDDVTNVRSLRLWQQGFTDSALIQVKKLTSLESLDLEGTAVGGAELGQLQDLPKLRTLVPGPATEDIQVEALRNFSALEELDLRGCHNLSDAALVHLEKLTNLQTVWLPQQITDEGELELLQKLPNCKIQR
jgi:hypothetical protein